MRGQEIRDFFFLLWPSRFLSLALVLRFRLDVRAWVLSYQDLVLHFTGSSFTG
jgi:hypothetical protein